MSLPTIVRLPHDSGPKPHGEVIIRHISEYPIEEQHRMLTARDTTAEMMRKTAARNRARDEAKRKRKERMDK